MLTLFCVCVFSVSRLHERWLKDCVFYRDLYRQMNEIGLQPRINWIQVFNQKQVSSKGGNHSFSMFTMFVIRLPCLTLSVVPFPEHSHWLSLSARMKLQLQSGPRIKSNQICTLVLTPFPFYQRERESLLKYFQDWIIVGSALNWRINSYQIWVESYQSWNKCTVK